MQYNYAYLMLHELNEYRDHAHLFAFDNFSILTLCVMLYTHVRAHAEKLQQIFAKNALVHFYNFLIFKSLCVIYNL